MQIKRSPYRMLRHTPLLLLCLLGLGGCDDSGMPTATVTSDDISVSVRLAAGSQNETRATDDPGTPIESRIDLDNLKILVFDKNQVLHDVLYDNGKMDQGGSLLQVAPGEYLLKTRLDPTRYNTNSEFSILALANWQTGESNDPDLATDLNGEKLDTSGIGVLTISDLKQMSFTLNPRRSTSDEEGSRASWIPKEGSLIPMAGSRYTSLKGYDNTIYSEAHPMPVPEIRLVRAVTKIEIINRDTDHGPEIKGIDLMHRNTRGWLMQDFTFTGATDNVTLPTLRGDSGYTGSPLPFHRTGDVFTAYIPEFEFSDVNQRQAIRVRIDRNGTDEVKWIYLAPYTAASLPILQGTYSSDWDTIKRNYIYSYTINSLGFDFVIEAMPWKFGGKVHIELE